MKRVLYIFVFILPVYLSAQIDTAKVMDYNTFISRVLEHHPRVYQADIVANSGDAQLLKSRGGFDPKLEGSIQQKYFKDDQYYSLINGGLKVPTWFGLTAKAGYDQNQGGYLNPADRLPNSGLWYAGLELELGKGLLIDERRAELKKAKLFQEGSKLQQTMIKNELVFEASEAYAEWMSAYFQKQTFEIAVENAAFRLEGVRGTVAFGDRPFIDTVEASIQWQTRLFGFNQAQLDLKNAEEKLQLFLWQDGFVPLELDNAIPAKFQSEELAGMFGDALMQKDSLITNHPYILLNDLKLEQSEIDLRLKKEQLKPGLTLKYNALSQPVGNNPIAEYSINNYSWGGAISYPILTRKERGDVRLSKLKVEDTKLENTQIAAKVNYSINVSENKLYNAIEQLELFEQTLDYYERLYLAEKSLFEVGESSLFMINAREKSYLEAQLKQIELMSKALIAGNELNYQLMIGI